MSRTEDFETELWECFITKKVTPDARLLYIWSWTRGVPWSGVYRIALKTIVHETGLRMEQVAAALRELQAKGFLVYGDEYLWVCDRASRIRARSPGMAKAVANDLRKMPDEHPLKRLFLARYENLKWLRGELKPLLDDLAIGSPTYPENGEGKGERGYDPDRSENLSGVGVLSSKSSSELTERSQGVRDLFTYWQEKCGHPSAKLGKDRRAKIEARLAEGYTPEQIRQGIDGAAKNAYVDDNGHRFDDIELICRNGSKLESFIARSTSVRPISSAPSARMNASDLLRKLDEADAAERSQHELA